MLIVTYYLVYFNYFLILFLCLVFRLTFIQKKCKINTVGPEYDLSGLGATIVIEDKFSSFPVRVFLLKGEVDEETAAEISELLTTEDGLENLKGDLANLPEPDYTLTDTLVFSKVTSGFLPCQDPARWRYHYGRVSLIDPSEKIHQARSLYEK